MGGGSCSTERNGCAHCHGRSKWRAASAAIVSRMPDSSAASFAVGLPLCSLDVRVCANERLLVVCTAGSIRTHDTWLMLLDVGERRGRTELNRAGDKCV